MKTDKFKCVECGQNKVDDEDDVCEDCWEAENEDMEDKRMMRTHTFENSSMLSSCEYNDKTEELTVTFTNGKDYTYIDVPKRTWDELITAESAGKYFNNAKKTLTIKPKE